MKQIFLPLLGILGLLLVFSLVHFWVQNIEKSRTDQPVEVTQDYSLEAQSVGEVGGAHYLRYASLEDQDGFRRFVIETQLNRASVLEDVIATPYTTAQIAADDPKVLVLSLADTTRIYEEEGRTEDIYEGPNGAVSDSLPITHIEVAQSSEAGQEIRMKLDSDIKGYRLQVDPENSSNLWVDILE